MSVLSLCQQTGLLAEWTRPTFASQNKFGEMKLTNETVHSAIPIRKQTMRQEDYLEYGIPTNTATINWLAFLPLAFPAGTPLDIRSGDRLTVTATRQQNAKTYFKVVIPENAVEENNHWEIILQEFTSLESQEA